jgi:hypothetical protein
MLAPAVRYGAAIMRNFSRSEGFMQGRCEVDVFRYANPKTLNPKTLNPKPSTQNPQPKTQTQNHNSQTPKKPLIPNPKFKIPNRETWTLNPGPYTRYPKERGLAWERWILVRREEELRGLPRTEIPGKPGEYKYGDALECTRPGNAGMALLSRPRYIVPKL